MKIVAALSWYNEPVEFLDRMVRSLAGVADFLLAVDGRWDYFPGDRDLSPLEEKLAIEDAARAIGLQYVIHGGGAPFAWATQVEKRDYLMGVAAVLGDWILVIDGDEYLEAGDVDSGKQQLAETELDVAQILVKPLHRVWPHSEMNRRRGRQFERPVRRLYRSAAGVTLPGPAHNGYITADGRWLMGYPNQVTLEPAEDLTAALALVHDVGARPRARREAAKSYYRARHDNGIEVCT